MINRICNPQGTSIWQRNYYEHINRSEESLERIREYILNNPLCWTDDPEYRAREREILLDLPF